MTGTQTVRTFSFGQSGDLPLSSDRNADGIVDPVLYRPSNSTFYTKTGPGTGDISRPSSALREIGRC